MTTPLHTLLELPYVFLTGSAAWLPQDEANDLDLCVNVEHSAAFSASIAAMNPISSEPCYFGSVYYTFPSGLPINAIFLNSFEWDIWKKATTLMKELPVPRDRVQRYVVFETLRAAVKLAINRT